MALYAKYPVKKSLLVLNHTDCWFLKKALSEHLMFHTTDILKLHGKTT